MNKDNIQDLLALLQFESDGQFYFKSYPRGTPFFRTQLL